MTTEFSQHSDIDAAEQNLKAKAAEFERTLDQLTHRLQEGVEFVRKFREDTSQFAETVRRPGAVLQPYLEKGFHLAEEYIQSYVTEAAESIEEGTERVLGRLSESLETGIKKIETRPLIPGVALFFGGFVLGTWLMRQQQRPRKTGPSLFRIEGGIPQTSSSAPSK